MSRLSAEQADSLRTWLAVMMAIDSSRHAGVRTPDRPVGWMILVFVAVQESETVPYAQVLKALAMEDDPSKLSQAVKLLADFVISTKVGRESCLKLKEPGWHVVEEIYSFARGWLKS